MKILITGGYGFIGSHTAEYLSEEGHRISIIDNLSSGDTSNVSCKHKSYKIDIEDKKCEEIYRNSEFDVVVHLVSSNSNMAGFINMLELCSKYKVKRFIYASSTEIYHNNDSNIMINEEVELNPISKNALDKYMEEQYSLRWQDVYKLDIVCFRISQVYGPKQRISKEKDNIACYVSEMMVNNILEVNGNEEEKIDLIYVSDVAIAIGKACESYITGIYNLTSGSELSLKELVATLREVGDVREVNYSGRKHKNAINSRFDNTKVKKDLDWIPIYDIEEGLKRTYGWYKDNQHKVKDNKKSERKNKINKEKNIITPYIENISILILIELITRYPDIDLFIGNTDLKVFYIIIISISYGLRQATLAILICTVLFFKSSISSGRSIFSLIQDTSFILNVSMYFVVGLFVSYMIDRRDRILKEEKRKYKVLEERYQFLKELYDETYTIKNELQNQIVNSEDSFGKIYGVIKELDSLEPQYIFKAAISVLENLLRTQEIYIYTVDKTGNYMRLSVKSSKAKSAVKKTIKIDDFSEAKNQLMKGDIFVNKELRPDMPLLMAPIKDANKLIGVIIVHHVEFERITLYYQNLFKVVCNLITSSLIIAYSYENATASDRYYKSTILLNAEFFKAVLDIRQKSKEENKSEFTMLYIKATSKDYEKLASIVSRCIRETDFAGIGQDGNIYLILNNTTENDSSIVIKRLEAYGVRAFISLGVGVYA